MAKIGMNAILLKKLAILFCLLVSTATHLISQIADDNIQSMPQGCSSFCLDNNGYAIFGANYDYVKNKHDGLVIVNKRNVSKSFRQPDALGEHVYWTSKYGLEMTADELRKHIRMIDNFPCQADSSSTS